MHSPWLFAFGFASPWMLWGLLAAGAPILIHLLNKRKFRETEWAAMKFLLEAMRKHSRRIQLEQWILLAVRALILIGLALAMARPHVAELGNMFAVSQPAHRILVLDASLSMSYQAGDLTQFDRAREVARHIVDQAHQGDLFNLVKLTSLPQQVVIRTPAFQPREVLTEIDQLTCDHARGEVSTQLTQIEELLALAPDVPRKEIYFISDLQRATWKPEGAEQLAQMRSTLKRLSDLARLIVIDLGQLGADNVAVTDFAPQETLLTTGKTARFSVRLRNHGAQRLTQFPVELYVDGKLAEHRRVDLPAESGRDVVESFSHLFTVGGEHRLQIRLPSDGLLLDDQRWLTVSVKDRIRVLCINGQPAAGNLRRATDFLELALSPTSATSSMTGPGPARNLIETQVVSEGELPGLNLHQYDCVFVCNVGLFTAREADLLENYMKAGGGVIWCLGDRVDAANYNQVLYRDGKGLLPARLGDRRIIPEADRFQQAFEFASEELKHPITRIFEGNPDAGLETTRTYVYVRTQLEQSETSRVALRFQTRDPAIIEKPVGTGLSLLVTTSVDDRWGNWPLWPSFVPLLHEMVHYAVVGRTGQRRALVGEPLQRVVHTGPVEVEATVTRPDGQTQPLSLQLRDGTSLFRYEGTEQSGFYEVTWSHPLTRTEHFSVNIDPRESDLAKMLHEDLTEELLPGIDYAYRTHWQAPAEERQTQVSSSGSLTRWLLYATLYLLFVEQLLAWDFRTGIWWLCPPLVPLYFLRRWRRPA